MGLFKRKNGRQKKETEIAVLEKRIDARYKPGADFPVKITLINNKVFEGKIIDLTNEGFSANMDSKPELHAGDIVAARISLIHYHSEVKVRVVRVWVCEDSFHCAFEAFFLSGKHPVQDYLKITLPVIVGSSLREIKAPSGNRIYIGEEQSRLLLCCGKEEDALLTSFEFKMNGFLMRGNVENGKIDILTNNEDGVSQEEKMLFFHWVVLNLGESVPMDVKNILKEFTNGQLKKN
jgi:hypothetical protein